MRDPKCKRYHRKCEDFSLCVNVGEKGYVLAEHSNERYCAFYYGVSGKGKFGRLFDPNYIIMEGQKLYNVQDYMNESVVFEAIEDFHLIGFNTLDKSIKWGSKLITEKEETFSLETEINFIICLNGKIEINGKTLKRYDYANVEKNKTYKIDKLDNGECCIFYQL